MKRKQNKMLPEYLQDADLVEILINLFDEQMAIREQLARIEAQQAAILTALSQQPEEKNEATVSQSIPEVKAQESRAAPDDEKQALQEALERARAKSIAKNDGASEAELMRRAKLSLQQKKIRERKDSSVVPTPVLQEKTAPVIPVLYPNWKDEAQKISIAFRDRRIPISKQDAENMAKSGATANKFLNQIRKIAAMPHMTKNEKKKRNDAKTLLIKEMLKG